MLFVSRGLRPNIVVSPEREEKQQWEESVIVPSNNALFSAADGETFPVLKEKCVLFSLASDEAIS